MAGLCKVLPRDNTAHSTAGDPTTIYEATASVVDSSTCVSH